MSKQLKYLFTVEFVDGSSYAQTPDDVSNTDSSRNCYFDVCEMVKQGKTIRRFSLVGDGHKVTVDLGSGIFYVDNLPLLLESDRLPTLPDKFELIWYHQVTRSQNVTYDTNTKEILKRDDQPEYREYFIGWQCNINGKNYQQKLGVS